MGKAIWRAMALVMVAGSLPLPAFAEAVTGPETGLPLPRFVSLKAPVAYVRRGPSRRHRIDWEFVRRGMPLEVVAEYDNWRRVRDLEGIGGWVHFTLLSGVRTVIVTAEMPVILREDPGEASDPVAQAEPGVIARLGPCEARWCEISADGYRGWVPAATLWGTDRHLTE